MNFYSISIARVGDCLRTVKNISEIGDCPITDKKLALKLYNQQKKYLCLGSVICLLEDGIVIKEHYETRD